MRRLLLLLLSLVAAPAGAQQAVHSAGPDHVAVTVYRAPYRTAGTRIDGRFLGGYALITETRRVHLPAGRAVIRFEGVAGGIFPETAIVGGLPAGVREKNLDADLLSPRSLYDRSLGRRVLIERISRKTGKRQTEQAVIRSSAAGAAVLETADGVETIRCDDWPEHIVYPSVPPGLTPKPTLSVETDSPRAAEATLTLSYLAGGFDWQTDYVVTMGRDGVADLFAWVTLANGDVTGFPNADTQVIAGRLNRTATSHVMPQAGALRLQCWPKPDYASHQSAADIVVTGSRRPVGLMRFANAVPMAMPAPPPPPAPKVATATQEELGDLKLYRLPMPVTVAAKAQKQVAMFDRHGVALSLVYVSDVYDGYANGARLTLRTTNTKANGLGLPLPAGRAAVFEGDAARPVFAGSASLEDHAVGEKVEFELDPTPAVQARVTQLSRIGGVVRYRLTASNAHPWPIAFEAKIRADRARPANGGTIAKVDGVPLWRATVPANGTATLEFATGR